MVVIEREGDRTVITSRPAASLLYRMWYSVIDLYSRVRELYRYRELVRNLVVRDLKVRYRNSILGVLWSLINPLLMMTVFTVVFTVMTPIGVDDFPVFALCGLLPWNLFSTSVVGSIRSIVDNAPLVRKVYFPREVLPISIVLANLVNFLISMPVLFAMLVVFGRSLTWWALLLPVVIAIQVVFTAGIALILATVNVFYRDTQIIMEVLMLAWFFLTPVFYPIDVLPHNYDLFGVTIDVWRWTHILNPMASLIATYRVLLYDGAPPAFDFLARTTATSFAVLVVGGLVFYRFSRVFGEEV